MGLLGWKVKLRVSVTAPLFAFLCSFMEGDSLKKKNPSESSEYHCFNFLLMC